MVQKKRQRRMSNCCRAEVVDQVSKAIADFTERCAQKQS